MTLKIIGFIIKVLKLAYDTFVEKPPVRARVRPMLMPKPMKRMWMFGAAALGLAALIVLVRWFMKPTALPPGKSGSTDVFPADKRKPELAPQTTHKQIEQKAASSAPAGQPDDLTLLSGIGQKTALVLANSGVTTFEKIAAMSPEALAGILKQGGIRIANPTNWPEQAAFAVKGDWSGLKSYLAGLKGSQG